MRLTGVSSARAPLSNSGRARGWVLPERVVTWASSTGCRMRVRGLGSLDCADVAGEAAKRTAPIISMYSKLREIRGIRPIPAAQTGEAETFLAGDLTQFRTRLLMEHFRVVTMQLFAYL